MIVFDLKCEAGAHVFEAWFGSSADYADQRERGLISCPLCGDTRIGKAVMAPRLATSRSEPGEQPGPVISDPEAKQMLAAMAAMQRKLLARSEHVGTRFAAEARSIQLGEAEARAIHGQATRAEAEALREEGIPVAPLPFPVIEPGQEN